MRYRADIDGLRCLAVAPVVLCHAGIPGFSGGYIGVDIFFVISGFLITRIISDEIHDQRFSITRFYERRFRRILPTILAVIVACLLAGWFLLLPDEYASLGKSSVSAIFFASNIRFFWAGSDYFAADVAFDPLLHTWSLAVEEQFYVLFPLLLIVLSGRLLPYRLTAIILLVGLSFALSVWGVANFRIGTFYLLPTRFWELGLGALLALAPLRLTSGRATRETGGMLGLFMIVASVALLKEGSPFPGLAALPACAGTALLIWSGADGDSLASKILSIRPLVFIGLISYSLYLWHWPLLVFIRLGLATADLPLWMMIFAVVASCAVATISWKFIEQPFRRQRITATPAPTRTNAWPILLRSGAAMSGVAALACFPIVFGGFANRVAAEVQESYVVAKNRGSVSVVCEELASRGDPCSIGEDLVAGEEPDLVIWGDSHALAMLGALNEVLDEEGLAAVAYAKPACASLLGITRTDKDNGEACEVHNRNVLRELRDLSGDQTVLLISRWALLTEGERALGEAGSGVVLSSAGGDTNEVPELNSSMVMIGLDVAVRELTEEGMKVIVMRPTPEFGYDIPKALVRQLWTGIEPRALKREDYMERVHDTNEIIDTVVLRYDAETIDLAHLLCPDVCKISVKNEILYQDDDHLSRAGAEWLLREMLARGLLEIEETDG